MARKKSAEKAAKEIGDKLAAGEFDTVAAVVEAHPELSKGAELFESNSAPKSRGSGPMIREINW